MQRYGREKCGWYFDRHDCLVSGLVGEIC